MSGIVTLYVTVSDTEQARSLARTLIDEHLAACANILPGGRSIYRWNGDIVEEGECYVLFKTRAKLADAAVARLSELHEYDVPCIAVWPWSGGDARYMAWVRKNTRDTDPAA
ncbi:MAG: divalent-cation tolerance protein CutA [Rhodothalassiaceae bacterium]